MQDVLRCTLRKDVQYTKANPTFHHWKTGERRFGLTFQNSADARAFSKAVKTAMSSLYEG
jgi:sprouty-related EVH1 domain-containing protein